MNPVHPVQLNLIIQETDTIVPKAFIVLSKVKSQMVITNSSLQQKINFKVYS